MNECCKHVKTPYCPECGTQVFNYDMKTFAIALHAVFCKHSDCRWKDEIALHDRETLWKQTEHNMWYMKAIKVSEQLGYEGYTLENCKQIINGLHSMEIALKNLEK